MRLLDQSLTDAIGKLAGVTFYLEDYADGEVELVSLAATQVGQGYGSKAMQSIVDKADALGIHLMLIPGGDQDKRERLQGFYSRFGFEQDGDVMRRRALKTWVKY